MQTSPAHKAQQAMLDVSRLEGKIRELERRRQGITFNRQAGGIVLVMGIIAIFAVHWDCGAAALLGGLTYVTAVSQQRRVDSELRAAQDELGHARARLVALGGMALPPV